MDISTIRGLAKSEVINRQKRFGYNEIPDREHKNIIKIVFSILAEPMILLLVVTVVIYFFLGDKGEASLLLLSIAGIVGIELYQDAKTEKSLEALKNLSSPIATVIRDGRHLTVPGRDLVCGDVIIIAEGSRVPADARLMFASNLQVDESLLTGESVPVEKHTNISDDERLQNIYSGTLVVKGHGVATVTAIGQNTEIGAIGKSLSSIGAEKTLLQKEVTKVVEIVATVAISISVILTIAYWLILGDFVHGLLAGLTLSISILPEEFPVVLTLFLTIGAWRLAKSNVLTHKASTIETLGSATVLCVDKTGTLTQNRMEIMAIIDAEGNIIDNAIPIESEIIKYGVLASQKKPFDPMEEAFIAAGQKSFNDIDDIYQNRLTIREFPLDDESMSVVYAWAKNKNNIPNDVALKGAPEAVFELCSMGKKQQKLLFSKIKHIAQDGLRVIAIAKAINFEIDADKKSDYNFEFLGLVGLADPIRHEVPAAVKTCYEAGIRVIMITGDYPETAKHIAAKIGFDKVEVINGADFRQMSESEREKAIKDVSIFSRVSPSDKLYIVKALKACGEIVAMTGDGVNDAPALKSAHIGVAMGKNGTDVAREAATIVLLDDNFSSIVHGIRLGRRIYDNLQKAMAYVLAVHVPIVALSLLPVFFGWPPILIPIHIVFLEFVIDPSCTIIFEGEKENSSIMKRPPRKLSDPVFSRKMVIGSLIQGLFIAVFVVSIYAFLHYINYSHDEARSITFISLIISNILLIAGISGKYVMTRVLRGENKAMITIFAVTLTSLIAIFSLPPLRELFKFTPISNIEVIIAITLGVISVFGILPLRYFAHKIIK